MYEWLTEVLPYVAGYLVVGATFAWAWVALDGDHWVFEGEETPTEVAMFLAWPVMLAVVAVISMMRVVVKLCDRHLRGGS